MPDPEMSDAEMTREIAFTVNGQPAALAVEERFSLADMLRHRLGLTGTHLGCEHGVCGACTVMAPTTSMSKKSPVSNRSSTFGSASRHWRIRMRSKFVCDGAARRVISVSTSCGSGWKS